MDYRFYQRDQTPSLGPFPRYRWRQGINALSPQQLDPEALSFPWMEVGDKAGKGVSLPR